jgi:protein-arginine kinase
MAPHPSRFASAAREWPDGRGAYISDDAVFFVSVGSGEEHVDIACKALGGDIRTAFEHVIKAESMLGESMKTHGRGWMHSEQYGYLTSDIEMLHTGLSVHVVARVPHLAKHVGWGLVVSRLKLFQCSASSEIGEVVLRTSSEASLLSGTEVDIIQHAAHQIAKLVQLEMTLASGGSIEGKY